MKLREIKELLNATVLCGDEYLDREIETCCGSDLMSDVLAFTKYNTLLCTGLNNIQVMRTADVSALSGVVLVRGKRASHEFLLAAEEQKTPVLTTEYTLFESCGILYMNGIKGCTREA